MMHARTIAGFLVLAIAAIAQADEIRLAPEEIENLGIRFEKLSVASDAAGFEATAVVVLPTTSDTVISTLQSGLLTRLAANVGDEVDQGQVLAELSSPEFISLQREFLDALNNQRLAQSEYDRDAQLQAEGIISARRLQESKTHQAVAAAALNEHRQLLRFAGMRDADIRSLEDRQRLLDSLLIRAPFSGVIAERMASTGERLDPMSPIYRLVDLSELWLDINVRQEQLALVRVGARVEAAGNFGERGAVVTTIGRSIDPASQSAIVRARLDAGGGGLMPGQFVAVRIATDAGTTVAHGVPAAAVTRSGTASYVFVRTAAGVKATEVEVVGVNEGVAYVRGNLDEDDTIAANGVSALKALWAALEDEES
jgi:cobalt-zinc-cadmium efflux system membrane fusion protein